MPPDLQKIINELTGPRIHFGTSLDTLVEKGVHIKHPGISFRKMSHMDLEEFILANNIKKFEMAFWAEYTNARSAFWGGFWLSTLIFVILIILVAGYAFGIK
ncbi:MAG: hypothetical protein V4519_01230 [Patescibacteria group bacterium]